MIGRRRKVASGRVPDAYELTFPQMLRYRAEHDGDAVGLATQEYGIWHEWTWGELWEECAALGEGLHDAGVQRGQMVAFIGDPCIHGLLVTIAAQGIGALPFGIYPTTPPEGVRFLLDDGEAVTVVCEDQEFVDKVLDGAAAEGRDVVVIDAKGMFAPAYAGIGRWDALLARGRELRTSGSTVWDDEVAAGKAEDVCGIYYTSGTTGMPKGAELTHRNVTSGWPAPFYDDMVPGLGPQDRTFCEVPVASLAGPLMGIYFPLVFGSVGYIPDDDADIGAAMAEASPTFYLGFPRIWEVRASHTLVEIETSSRLHRVLFAVGMRLRRYWMAGKGPLRAIAGGLGYLLIVRPMLDRWGLLRGRFILSGGAPLSPDLVRLWRLWGVTIRELYGSTESSGMCSIQADADPEPGTAGKPLPRTEIKIAGDREILVKGPCVFGGYWKREEATAEAFADGWLRTGDIGELREDGNLVVIDRKRDVLRMANGAEVPASSVEHVLKYSPYIRDALLVGEGKPALGALIEIDPDTVAQWARTKSVSYTGFTNLAQNEAVVQLVQDAIDEANEKLQERGSSVVTRFRILPKELDPEDPSEITATRKIRRRQLAEKFSELVDEMFMTEETARIASHARGAELVSTSEEER